MKTFRLSVCEVLTMIALIVIALCVTVPTFAQAPPLPYDDSTPPPVTSPLHVASLDVHSDIAGLPAVKCACGPTCSCIDCDCNDAAKYQVQLRRVCRPGDASCASCGTAAPTASYAPVGNAQGPVRAGLRRAGGRVRRVLTAPFRLLRGGC